MNKNNYILASVIILNYYGERVLEDTVNSVLNSGLSKDKYEIIIVDNNSKDKSEEIIKNLSKKNKNIKPLFLDKNYGFSKGNNQGIKIANGKYIVLLNNDCVVDKSWLEELINFAEKKPKIFSVNSKILLYPTYFPLEVQLETGIVLKDIKLTQSNLISYTKDNCILIPFEFYPENNSCKTEIPFDKSKDKKINIEFTIYKDKKSQANKLLKLRNLPENSILQIKKINFKKHIKVIVEIDCTNNFFSTSVSSKIQNAGSIVFQDGYGRDIGANVKYQTQNYEDDIDQYNEAREVYSTCGAAVLYKKEILDKIGYLDETFFMYYEDTEISERARILGYKNYYNPKAIARHLHALSSKEWSPFFIYNVEKGRLLHLFYNFPIVVYIKEFLKFIIKSKLRLLRNIKNRKSLNSDWQYIKVIFDLLYNLPKYRQIKKAKYKGDNVGIKENYNSIINGSWYSN